MKRYEPSTPRAGLGLIAIAVAAITIGVVGVLPAAIDSLSTDPSTVAVAKVATKAPVEKTASPARADAPDAGHCDEYVDRAATVGAQEARRKRLRASLRGRANTRSSPSNPNIQDRAFETRIIEERP